MKKNLHKLKINNAFFKKPYFQHLFADHQSKGFLVEVVLDYFRKLCPTPLVVQKVGFLRKITCLYVVQTCNFLAFFIYIFHIFKKFYDDFKNDK